MFRMFSLKWFAEFFRVSSQVTGLDVNWSLAECFWKSVSANTTFTFSNTADGKPITLYVHNSSGATITVAFPAGIIKPETFELTVDAGKYNVYTFVKINNIIFVSVVPKMGV